MWNYYDTRRNFVVSGETLLARSFPRDFAVVVFWRRIFLLINLTVEQLPQSPSNVYAFAENNHVSSLFYNNIAIFLLSWSRRFSLREPAHDFIFHKLLNIFCLQYHGKKIYIYIIRKHKKTKLSTFTQLYSYNFACWIILK